MEISNIEEAFTKRMDRLESRLAIQELAVRYALAVDSRDINAWINLFVPEVNCGRFGTGREALRQSIEPLLRTFYRSIHLLCGQAVDFDGPDHATGKVYCRAEHEVGDRWVVVPVLYSDEYARLDGHWYFVRRKERHWYSTDLPDRPNGDNLNQWGQMKDPELPGCMPSWAEFWKQAGPEAVADVTTCPVPPSEELQMRNKENPQA